MEVLIKPNYEGLSNYAAEIIANQIKEKPSSVLGLATGSTPTGTYSELIKMHKKGLDFSEVSSFNLDEYLGIGIDLTKPPEQDQSYVRFMYENLFKHINIKPENTFVPDGKISIENGKINLKKLEDYCEFYEAEIKKRGGIDIQILGIGVDGHIGFNEPGSSLYSRTRLEALDKSTLEINWEKVYKKAGGKKEDMPHFAITMGVGTILEARHLLLLANGESKAEILAEALEGPITSQITASYLQFHPNLTVVADEEAAAKLSRRKHYRHVEELKRKFLTE